VKPQLFSGSRGIMTVIGLNGTKTLLFITDLSISVTNSVRAPHTFGSPAARSTEPLSTSCNLSFGRVIPVNTGAGAAVDSSMIAIGIEPLINQLTSAEDVQIMLNDEVTGATVANVLNLRFTGRTMTNAAGNLANERVTMIGIYDSASGNTAQVGL
jgi:hypothetical protein